jgi:hypothetical protein
MFTRIASELPTKFNFTGEFKEPVIEKPVIEKQASAESKKCSECGEVLEYGRHSMDGKPCKVVDEKKEAAKKSWLTAEFMKKAEGYAGSDDPEPYKDSEQIEENENYVLWQTPYKDHTSYWVSDKTGDELNSFNTIEEARAAMATGKGLEVLDEASLGIKEDMPRASMSDSMSQMAQVESQVLASAKDKLVTEAVNSLVAMLHGMGYGTAKIAEVTDSTDGLDVMAAVDDAGAVKAVSIPVTIKDAKVVLPKKSLVSALISKGLDIRAKLSEQFDLDVLEKMAAAEEKAAYETREAEAILSERIIKTAGDEPKTQFEGTNEVVYLNHHLIPDALDLDIGNVVHLDGISYKLVSKSKDQLSKGDGDASTWVFEKVNPAATDSKK